MSHAKAAQTPTATTLPHKWFQIDVKENAGTFEVSADVPGVPKEGVKVELSRDNRTLYISAEKRSQAAETGDRDGWTFHREERSSEQRSRAVRLPPSADPTRVSARVVEGVLHVTIPKLPDGAREVNGRTPIAIA
jgi:HSP20 family protein